MAKWGDRHASAMSTHVLNAVTQLGNIYTVIVLCVVLAVAETIRERSVWVVAVHRRRHGRRGDSDHDGQAARRPGAPDLQSRSGDARAVVPERPLGDSCRLLRHCRAATRSVARRPARAVLAGLAAGIAVAVAASRVLLDVHWLTDVIAGLALGWAWFAVCAIAFGGRILRFGAAAETAARVADVTGRAQSKRRRGASSSPFRSPSASRRSQR